MKGLSGIGDAVMVVRDWVAGSRVCGWVSQRVNIFTTQQRRPDALYAAEERERSTQAVYERECARHEETKRRCAGLGSRVSGLEAERDRLIAQVDGTAQETPPGMTAAQIERLAVLADAAGHVAAEAGWVLREGWVEPPDGVPARVAMERVLGRMQCVIRLMYDAGDVRGGEMRAWRGKFRRILAETTRHQSIDMSEDRRQGPGISG